MLLEYKCEKCNKVFKKYFSKPSKQTQEVKCKDCGELCEVVLGSPGSHYVKVIDPGNYAKAVEVRDEILLEETERLKLQ